jgi:hypothetical protein
MGKVFRSEFLIRLIENDERMVLVWSEMPAGIDEPAEICFCVFFGENERTSFKFQLNQVA